MVYLNLKCVELVTYIFLKKYNINNYLKFLKGSYNYDLLIIACMRLQMVKF